ncbi:ATP-binding protein [Nocardioides sp. AX2bis]|uniref:ATP-binding protein n=1 Tax=Nocardioides sp. AX2bis TaxID=2653157 RepID=UPI0012F0FADC|nr:biotin carboxylase N-terminal domain-containing protein [Nocardioides sp. AX2bis]VXC39186.1 Biotin carboxylase / Biotin carboxyl carrier protein [Nocardioides sp. AX2bis]
MTTQHRFSSVLVANRGEIARRVIRGCRDAGLRTVAVYSDADARAPFVAEADTAVRLGPTPAAESYLSVERLLAAAAASGAEAVHPGYGFLSENAGFARAVRDAGLVWIGPTPEVIDLMGRKDHAREVAERAGVPVTPRYPEDDVPAEAFPVLVKAAAGGGGKGMHVVRDPADLAEAVARARREARSAFGDDTLLVETYVERGRHVEVQVVGDEHGHVVHLFERDCSAQRRHQKVVEEAPAPYLDETVRRRLLESSVALCQEVGYTGAGTVEFLVDGDGPDAGAYFLEMNTRLQVEHPVTEEVTGIDLVAWQLLVAQGSPLPLAQEEITCTGHAVEVRVYAEDPYAGFVPQTGRVHRLLRAGGARHEWGVEQGGTVGTAYDPMLAKVVVTGPDRGTTLALTVLALDHTAVLGVVTNTGFLRRLVASEAFRTGEVHTSWLDGPAAEELLTAPTLAGHAAALAAQAWADEHLVVGPGPWEALDGWRSAGPSRPVTVTLLDPTGEVHEVPVDLGPRPHHLVDRGPVVVDRGGAWVVVEGHPWRFDRPDPARRGEAAVGDADVTSPMPGTVIELAVAVGDRVAAGQRLGAVEAMKMELALTAPHDGVVAGVGAAVGDQVPMGHVVVRVDPDPATEDAS